MNRSVRNKKKNRKKTPTIHQLSYSSQSNMAPGKAVGVFSCVSCAFAAIQELSGQQVRKDAEFAALRADNEALRNELESIKSLLTKLSVTH